MRLRASVRESTGSTQHRILGAESVDIAPRIAWLVIEPSDGAFFLLYLDEQDVCLADTWHPSLEEAKAQAHFEFRVRDEDWVDMDPQAPAKGVVRYLCVARLDRAEHVLLWEEDDSGPARLVVGDDGFLVAFASEAAAREPDARTRWNVSEDPAAHYELDAIEAWCASPDRVGDCPPLLNAWNLLLDLPTSESLFRAADARSLGLYDKLFHGCNLPSMSVDGERFEPVWTATETAALKHVLRLGIRELRARLR